MVSTDVAEVLPVGQTHTPMVTCIHPLSQHFRVYSKTSFSLLHNTSLGKRIIISDLAKIGEKAAGYSVSSNNLCSN